MWTWRIQQHKFELEWSIAFHVRISVFFYFIESKELIHYNFVKEFLLPLKVTLSPKTTNSESSRYFQKFMVVKRHVRSHLGKVSWMEWCHKNTAWLSGTVQNGSKDIKFMVTVVKRHVGSHLENVCWMEWHHKNMPWLSITVQNGSNDIKFWASLDLNFTTKTCT